MSWWLTSGESEWWAYLREVSDQGAVRGPASGRVYRLVEARGEGERPFALMLSSRYGDSFDAFRDDDRMEVQVWRLPEDYSSQDYAGLPLAPDGWATLCSRKSAAERLGAWANGDGGERMGAPTEG